MSNVNPLLKDFLVESSANLLQLECDLGMLEKDPDDLQRLASLFRIIHAMKGSCSYFGLSKLSFVTYVGENLVASLRDGHLRLNLEIRNALLAMAAAVREILGAIEKTGKEGEGDYTRLIDLMTQLQENSSKIARASRLDQARPSKTEIGSTSGHEATTLGRKRPVLPEVVSVHPSDSCLENPPTHPLPVSAAGGIRRDVGHLDQLVNLVGELALARTQALFLTARENHPAFRKITQRLNRVASELLGGVSKIEELSALDNLPGLSTEIGDPAAATTAEAADHTHHAAAALQRLVARFEEECLG